VGKGIRHDQNEDRPAVPVDEAIDPEAISFRAQADQKSKLGKIVLEHDRMMAGTKRKA